MDPLDMLEIIKLTQDARLQVLAIINKRPACRPTIKPLNRKLPGDTRTAYLAGLRVVHPNGRVIECWSKEDKTLTENAEEANLYHVAEAEKVADEIFNREGIYPAKRIRQEFKEID